MAKKTGRAKIGERRKVQPKATKKPTRQERRSSGLRRKRAAARGALRNQKGTRIDKKTEAVMSQKEMAAICANCGQPRSEHSTKGRCPSFTGKTGEFTENPKATGRTPDLDAEPEDTPQTAGETLDDETSDDLSETDDIL